MLRALSPDEPSPGLRRLLETKLDTVEKVELAAILAKHEHHQETIASLARELQVGHDVLERLAIDLARTGVVEVAGEGVRLVASGEDLALIAEATRLAAPKLVRVLSALALDRVRRR